MPRVLPFLPRRALERLEREVRSSAAHRSGIGTWRVPRVGWHWLPRRQRACPSAALDERVLAASRLTGRLADRQSARGGLQVPDSGPMHAAGPVFSHHDFDPRRLAAAKEAAGLTASSGDLVAWVDGDITDFGPRFVTGLLGPLVAHPSVQFVKGFYRRPGGGRAAGGGRVTELVARPVIARLFPHLAGIVQPLAGEYAGRRDVLEALPIVCGWGVDLALVVDVVAHHGLPALAQVALGTRRHRHRPLDQLSPQAMAILTTALRRAGIPEREAAHLVLFDGDHQGHEVLVEVLERPPLRTLARPGYPAEDELTA